MRDKLKLIILFTVSFYDLQYLKNNYNMRKLRELQREKQRALDSFKNRESTNNEYIQWQHLVYDNSDNNDNNNNSEKNVIKDIEGVNICGNNSPETTSTPTLYLKNVPANEQRVPTLSLASCSSSFVLPSKTFSSSPINLIPQTPLIFSNMTTNLPKPVFTKHLNVDSLSEKEQFNEFVNQNYTNKGTIKINLHTPPNCVSTPNNIETQKITTTIINNFNTIDDSLTNDFIWTKAEFDKCEQMTKYYRVNDYGVTVLNPNYNNGKKKVNIHTIDFRNTGIEYSNLYTFEFQYLTEIKFEHNKLKNIPYLIPKTVQVLRLDYNMISTINNNIRDDIYSTHNLRVITLSNNLITTIPDEIGNLRNLEKLILNSNKITKIGNGLCTLTKLRTLKLHDNQIKDLPENLGNLSNLKYLTLHDNPLSLLPYSIMLLRLKRLDLPQSLVEQITDPIMKDYINDYVKL